MAKINKSLLSQLGKKTKNNAKIEGYFLETSIQIKRLLGHPSHKDFIDKQLIGYKKLTSYFVFREFKQAVIVPLIDFYFVLKLEKHGLKEAFITFSDTSQKIRDIKEVNALIADLLGRKDLCDNKEKSLIYVHNYILLLFKLFKSSTDGYVNDLTNFVNSKIELEGGEESFRKFKEDVACNANCGQVMFWSNQKKHLYPLTDKNNLIKYGKYSGFIVKQPLLNEIKNDIKRSEMKSRCQALGDVIIAIECPKNLRLLTIDKAFIAFCEILQKKYGIVPSLTGLKNKEKIKMN